MLVVLTACGADTVSYDTCNIQLTLGCATAGTGGDANCNACDANGADDITCTGCSGGYALESGGATCESKFW